MRTIAAGAALLTVAAVAASHRAEATDVADNRAAIRSPGFLFDAGRYTTVQVPRARTHTYAHGINNRGQIAGGFDDPSFDGPDGMGHAIVRGRRGRFVQFDVPGAISTIANKISDRGHVVGGYNPTGISVGAPGTKGFVRYGGRLRTIYVPGSIETQALGVNNHGLVVGEYANADGTFHGFTWKRGRLTTFDLPSTNAALSDVNDSGIMVGSYFEAGGTVHGFLRDRRGRVHTIDAPGAPDFTFAADINNRGQIVGSGLNYDSDGNATSAAGFLLRKGVEGPFTPIDFPGALGTIPRGIDDQGRIVGIYANPEASPPAGLQLGMPMPD